MAITAEDVFKQVPIARTLGIEFQEFTPAQVVGILPLARELSTRRTGQRRRAGGTSLTTEADSACG